MKIDNICVLGEDGRMDYVADYIYKTGIDTSRNIEDASYSQIVVLPPVYKKNITISKPTIVFGGKQINNDIRDNEFVSYIDYTDNEEYVTKNAILTAEGIYSICKNQLKNIEGSNVIILGYGHCGKAIAKTFSNNNSLVSIMVRKKELKKEIVRNGYGYINLHDYSEIDVLTADIIINTIPAMIIDSEFIDSISRGTRIYDIASKPGGCDFEALANHGIFAKQYLGIPGRYYPKEAGKIIAEYVLNKFNLDH